MAWCSIRRLMSQHPPSDFVCPVLRVVDDDKMPIGRFLLCRESVCLRATGVLIRRSNGQSFHWVWRGGCRYGYDSADEEDSDSSSEFDDEDDWFSRDDQRWFEEARHLEDFDAAAGANPLQPYSGVSFINLSGFSFD